MSSFEFFRNSDKFLVLPSKNLEIQVFSGLDKYGVHFKLKNLFFPFLNFEYGLSIKTDCTKKKKKDLIVFLFTMSR